MIVHDTARLSERDEHSTITAELGGECFQSNQSGLCTFNKNLNNDNNNPLGSSSISTF